MNKILNAQQLISKKDEGKPAHDEHLFIIVHQTHELWFKQIIYELDYIREVFRERESVEERELFYVVTRLRRIIQIMMLLVNQIKILETMGPLDFMEFRELLVPASGFQSFQFRILENKLGLVRDQRHMLHQKLYTDHFKREEADVLILSSRELSVFRLLEHWLECLSDRHINLLEFITVYKKAVDHMLDESLQDAERKKKEDPLSYDIMVKDHQRTIASFESIFSSEVHMELIAKGKRRLSYKAFITALVISAYR